MATNYPVNERTIFEYKTNQKDIIMNGSEKNSFGFPNFWPTRNENNSLVFISFVDAEIYDLEDKLISDKATFDILDAETYSPKDKHAKEKVKYIGALLSPKYRVKGGVYVKGRYYTGQMKKPYAMSLYQTFMAKYFFIQDKEAIEKYFDRNEEGNFLFWPTKSRVKGEKIVFSAVDASVFDHANDKVIKEHINFDIVASQKFDLDNAKDKEIADTIFMMLDPRYTVRGFYYRGSLIPDRIDHKMKLYYEKGFIKKNFLIEQVKYLESHASTDENGQLLFYPMSNKAGDDIVVSFRNGSTPFGKQYRDFDIASNYEFDPRLVDNQYKIQIIDHIIDKDQDYTGTLYLDGILIPNKEKYREIQRRKSKVEKALRVRIDGDDDYIYIFNNFTTDDREKLLLMSDYHRTTYPIGGRVAKKFYSYNPKGEKVPFDGTSTAIEERVGKEDFLIPLVIVGMIIGFPLIFPLILGPILLKKIANNTSFKNQWGTIYRDKYVFDCVNILDKNGNFVFKEHYFARYDGPFTPNETEIKIFQELFKKHSLVRGGIYFEGRNINRKQGKLGMNFALESVKQLLDADQFNAVLRCTKETGCTLKMDKKSGMPVHWPTFDKNGREQILSVVDADVWFKVGRNIVKASNDINFNIYSGETFGLVGESGSGKTTISRAILGINKLRKGGIYWKGKLISSGLSRREAKANKKNIQMIFQDPAASLNERANIDYIVSEGLYSFHLFKNKEERLAKVTGMLREVGLLPEHLSRYPHEFSGGQRQRIGIARALIIEPELVLADEPISALDVSIRAQVLNLLKRLQKEQELTYLFIAHDLSIIRYISDRIAVMHNGYLVELGVAEEIYSNPLHPYTKSLLTAIPQPDPKSKDKRKKLVYDQGNIVYGECYWAELAPGHFVLVNDELKADILKQLNKQFMNDEKKERTFILIFVLVAVLLPTIVGVILMLVFQRSVILESLYAIFGSLILIVALFRSRARDSANIKKEHTVVEDHNTKEYKKYSRFQAVLYFTGAGLLVLTGIVYLLGWLVFKF